MDKGAGDLKLALHNGSESLQIHVEVHQKSDSTAKKDDIKLGVLKLLERHPVVFGDYRWTEFDDHFLTNNVQSIAVVDTELKLKERQAINLSKCSLSLHIFHLSEEGPSPENLEAEDENIVAANHWVLPTGDEMADGEHLTHWMLLDYNSCHRYPLAMLAVADGSWSPTAFGRYQVPHTQVKMLHVLAGIQNVTTRSYVCLFRIEFHGLWESLIYDAEIKSDENVFRDAYTVNHGKGEIACESSKEGRAVFHSGALKSLLNMLLDYVTTTLLFSDRNVNSNLISWNRVVLLHGPPGTGKTSLCKALAQKLTIRLSHRYRYGQLIEINSHSLFSKWFSESGKLVTKMFQKIQELIDDKDALVFVLIDEVESLTAARSAFRAGTEPSDAIRVVNAVLTQIDQIKRYPNVVILTTSNITEKIDMAFVDRADIKQYIGPPSAEAVFKIYLSCLEELMKCQIIYPRQQLLTLRELEVIGYLDSDVSKLSLILREISRKSEGLSGRVLRKLPFLAHALYIQSPSVTTTAFLQALSLVVDKQFEERAKLADCI